MIYYLHQNFDKGWGYIMNHIRKRILSLIAASALSCSLSTNVLQVLAEGSSPAVINYESSNLKEVIVKLKGNAVLATPEASDQGADYIDTPSLSRQKTSFSMHRIKQQKTFASFILN